MLLKDNNYYVVLGNFSGAGLHVIVSAQLVFYYLYYSHNSIIDSIIDMHTMLSTGLHTGLQTIALVLNVDMASTDDGMLKCSRIYRTL